MMKTKKKSARNKSGRPAKPMPELIPDTPENIAKACMQGPPKKDWDYLSDGKNENPGKRIK